METWLTEDKGPTTDVRTPMTLRGSNLGASSYEKERMDIFIQHLMNFGNVSTDIFDSSESEVSNVNHERLGRGQELDDSLHKIFRNVDNWDGFGTPKISDLLKQRCFEILESICQGRFHLPYVFPVAGGGMQFEWQHKGKELEIEFNENTISSLRTEVFEGNRTRYIEDENILINEIPGLITWLENL